ncbi:esterase/lipase family protein [Amycolatopsis sp. lyj-90]|uniref:esterase/lipase family protein n=1 Tax=Amycolatopsis sp. lyj-90 TaxID=2789285 RepID=UPI00397AC4DD
MTELVEVSTDEDPVLDVVFVHGLDGDALKSWSTKRKGSFWPEWLCRDITGLSVWSLGYDAASSRWLGHAMPIQDRAINLLALLESRGIGQRPLCFVTHSMGGLVVKEMLLHAADGRADYTEFATATRGVVFLATPHTGSDIVTQAVFQALSVVYRKTKAVDALERNSAHLRQLNTRYRNWAVDQTTEIEHKIFYETLRTKGVHVVDAGSADPAIPGQTAIPVDTNHIDICKPSTPSDLVYGQIKLFIIGIVTALHTSPTDTLQDGSPESTGQRRTSTRPGDAFVSAQKVELRERSPTRAHSTHRVRWWSRSAMVKRVAVATAVGVAVAVSVWVAVPTGSSSSPSPGTTQAVSMSAALQDESYRLVFPLNNVLASEQSVKRLHVIISFDSGVACAEVPPAVIFDVSDVVVAGPSGTITQGAVSAENGPAAGFKVPVSGSINYGCGWNQVQLSFTPPGAIMNRLTTTPIAIDVPRKIAVSYRRMPDSGPYEERLAMPTLEELGEERVVAFRAIAEVGDANTIESCFLIARSAVSGPQDCDYKLGSYQVFWRQIPVNAGEVRYER